MSPRPTTERLIRWYVCYRKKPLTAARAAERVLEEPHLSAFACEVDASHWHVGRRPDGEMQRPQRRVRAKQAYSRDIARGYLTWQGEQRPLQTVAMPDVRQQITEIVADPDAYVAETRRLRSER